MPRSRFVFLGVTVLLLTGLTLLAEKPAEPERLIRVGGTLGEYDLAELLERADAVAVVSAKGAPSVHWNSADNAEWASDRIGIQSHIYSDQTVEVLRVLTGALSGPEIVVRGVGGRVGDVMVEYDAAVEWTIGGPQLVFLRLEATPTREGVEQLWTVVWLEHGVFAPEGEGIWRNPIGLTADEAVLSR